MQQKKLLLQQQSQNLLRELRQQQSLDTLLSGTPPNVTLSNNVSHTHINKRWFYLKIPNFRITSSNNQTLCSMRS